MKTKVALVGLLLSLCRWASGQTELIVNGGFESGMPPWQVVGNGPVVTNLVNGHSGTNYLQLGSFGMANQVVYQAVTIPTNATQAALVFFWNVDTTSLFPDFMDVLIANTNGATLATVLSLSNANADFFYHERIFDLTPYIGQTILVKFSTQLNSSSTVFRIDDVSASYVTASTSPGNDSFTNRFVLTANSLTTNANNIFATKEPGEPNHAGNAGGKSLWWTWSPTSNGVVTITTAGSSFDTLLAVYTGSTVSNLTQVAANDDDRSDPRNPLVTSRVRFAAAAGTAYQIAVDGAGGAAGSLVLNLTLVPDTKPPTVSITSPAAGAKLTNSTVIVHGADADTLGVALVQFRLENAAGTNAYQAADGTNSWSATVADLVPGLNTVRVRAFDTSSNVSATVARSFNYVIVSPFTLTITGSGTVTPNLNGQLLDVGATYKLTAKPGAGSIFAGWTGGLTTNTASLTFTMQSNLVLQANFIPNPFLPVLGAYQGLFFEPGGVANHSAGFFAATLASSGGFSAKLQLAGLTIPFSGQFSATGSWSGSIPRKGLSPLPAQLQLDFASGRITGTIGDGVWIANLTANRAGYSKTVPAPQAGKYTLLIPGDEESEDQPGGDSFGAVTVDTAGNVTLSGMLADGTKLTQKAVLSAQGEWPLFASPYAGKGLLLGWLTFTNEPGSDIRGTMDWIKLAQATAKFYPEGFTNEVEALGSRYLFTNGIPVLNISTGQVWFANGNLPNSFTNVVTLDAANKIVNQSSNKLTLTVVTPSGLLKGNATDPVSGKTFPINGAVLQKLNAGYGFFLGTNQAGRLRLEP